MAYVRVMFLGKDGSGKSSVLGGLMGQPFVENRKSTRVAETQYCAYKWMGADTVEGHWNEWSEEDEQLELAHLAHKVLKNKQMNNESETSSHLELSHDTSEASKVESTKNKEVVPQAKSKVKPVTDREDSPQLHEKNISTSTSSNTAMSDLHKERLSYTDIDNFFRTCIKNVSKKAMKLESHTHCRDVLHVWDCGGQPVFLDIVSAFLTPRTFFVLVFNTKLDLKEPCGEGYFRREGRSEPAGKHQSTNMVLLIRWMRLIYAGLPRKTPKIILVGTHGDDVEDKEGVKGKLMKACEDERFNDILLKKKKIKQPEKGTRRIVGIKIFEEVLVNLLARPKCQLHFHGYYLEWLYVNLGAHPTDIHCHMKKLLI